MMISLTALVFGFLLDLVFGDPAFLYHPVRLIGKLISFLEKGFRRLFPETDRGKFWGGVCTAVLVIAVSTAVPALILYGVSRIHWILRLALETFWCYQLLALRSLKDESMKVYDRLAAGDLPGGRKAVSMIVGRDTQNLDEAGVTKAAVETVAENTSDGIIAPMLYMAVGGPVLGWIYKAVNTMDSMVGYKNETYLYFGRCAAKLDDLVNFIPARISAVMMMLACIPCRFDRRGAARIFRRDRFNHASPNSAQTEAVMAGALGVQLAGDAWYFGKRYKKKTIGDAGRPVEPEDIPRANRLLYVSAVLSLAVFLLARWGLLLWLRI